MSMSTSIRFFCLLIYVFTLSGCKVNRYYYTSDFPMEVHSDGYGSARYMDIPAGDTVFTENRWYSGGRLATFYNSKVVYKDRTLRVNTVGDPIYLFKKQVTYKVANTEKARRLTLDGYPLYGQRRSNYSPSTQISEGASGSGHTIQTGPRGGRYYINKNGNKTYIKRK